MNQTMRWLSMAGGFVALVGVGGSGCVIKSGDGDGSGGSGSGNGNGNGVTTGGNTTSTTGDTTTSTGSYGGGGGSTTSNTSTSSTGNPITCDYDQNDACDTCFKTSCCDQINACDAACQAEYGAYVDCLAPNGSPSGYNSNYCQVNYAPSAAAKAVIDCASQNCYTGSACGTEDPQETWNNYAGEFIERYCAGCHSKDYQNPNPPNQIITNYSTDASWFDVQGDPNWLAWLDYDAVTTDGDMIWCGVSKDLPAECATMFPGKFPNAQRFPPAGGGVNNLHCWWVQDPNLTCEQPSDLERAKLMNWIFAGYPQ